MISFIYDIDKKYFWYKLHSIDIALAIFFP